MKIKNRLRFLWCTVTEKIVLTRRSNTIPSAKNHYVTPYDMSSKRNIIGYRKCIIYSHKIVTKSAILWA